MFKYHTLIQMRYTDALSRLYFADQLNLCHDAYQAFMHTIGFPMPRMLGDRSSSTVPPFQLAIVHAESQYLARLMIDDPIEVRMSIASLGETSIAFQYALYRHDALVGRAKIIHVHVDPIEGGKRPIPPALREALLKHLCAVQECE